MAVKKYLDSDGLLYVWSKLKGLFVQKENGKGLSSNDFTNEQKNKLDTLQNYSLPTASADTLGGVKVGAGLAINAGVLSATGGGTADSVEWANVQNKPTNLSQFSNDSGFQTQTQVSQAISSALTSAVIYKGTVVSVSDLPANAKQGDMYNVADTAMNYVWSGTEWDEQAPLIDIEAISNAEIDTITAT